MSPERLPLIGSSRSKTTAKPPPSSAVPQRPHQTNRRKLNQQQQQQTSSTSSSSHPHPGPSSILLSDTSVTPWGCLSLSESSFASIPPPLPTRLPPPPPPPPPAPQPTPSTPYRGRQEEDEDSSSSSFNFETPSPPLAVPQNNAGGVGKGLPARRKVLPERCAPRPPRLPPLRPITNLSFSRSFTFSFFELPLHQSPRYRAQRVRNLLLLLRQINY
ncbi:probable LIM domain-containing serine/threonine-protein kinase DDB_G0286997 [Embiotoca jacksoni]|uniref:probable LIM domain-containing serine/threonine-protein kinase DDB_G0286997 n=1 Tax=Embiotoca jacksoni TaxID=100190 RepID=UPI0037047F67